MRDRLIHGYAGVDQVLVWDTAIKDVPEVKNKVEKLLQIIGI